MPIVNTVVYEGTWLGVRGSSVTHHLESDPTGLRINVFRLEGVSSVKIALIKGDGREFSLITYMDYTRHNPTKTVIKATVDSLVEYAHKHIFLSNE